MRLSRLLPIVVAAAALSATPAQAQFEKGGSSWYGHVFGGFSMPTGDMDDVATDGWVIGGGATYYPSSWVFGLTGELSWSDHGIEREVLDAFEASGGDVEVWAFTGGVVWSPRLDGPVGFTVSAGLGPYRTEGRLTEPDQVCGPVCPPWSWWCYPGCLPGSIVTDRVSSTDLGYRAAVGLSFELGPEAELLLEAAYHRVETDVAAVYVPLTIGLRW